MADSRDRPLPEHVTTPLLTLITARSIDEDYAHVAQQRAAAGRPAGRVVAAALDQHGDRRGAGADDGRGRRADRPTGRGRRAGPCGADRPDRAAPRAGGEPAVAGGRAATARSVRRSPAPPRSTGSSTTSRRTCRASRCAPGSPGPRRGSPDHGRQPARGRRQQRDPGRGPRLPRRRPVGRGRRGHRHQRPADQPPRGHPQHLAGHPRQRPTGEPRPTSSPRSATTTRSRLACCSRARGRRGSPSSIPTDSATHPRMSTTSVCRPLPGRCCVM